MIIHQHDAEYGQNEPCDACGCVPDALIQVNTDKRDKGPKLCTECFQAACRTFAQQARARRMVGARA